MRIIGKITAIVISSTVIGLSIFAVINKQQIYDWWRLKDYEPPARIAQLADNITLTEEGKKLFYVSYPELNSREEFRQNCTVAEKSIVLGCYVGNQGIYIFDVEDERLDGVHEVTAAHETLHSVYDRLSSKDKTYVDGLTAAFEKTLKDIKILETIDSYRQRDPSVVPNELHSIFATEVSDLPKELEDYYARYFDDRAKVVKFSKQYEAAFRERKDKVAKYDKELSALKQEIEVAQAGLNNQQAGLEQDRKRLDSLLANEQYESYNAGVPSFNAAVASYNNTVAHVRQLIDRFNALVQKRNSIALEENELIHAIDTRPQTIQAE